MDATWMITTFVLIDTVMTNLDHQNDVRVSEYINNLRTERKGETMAITNEERKLAKELTDKYSSTFDAI